MIDPDHERLRSAIEKVARAGLRAESSVRDDSRLIVASVGDADFVDKDAARASDAFLQRFEQMSKIMPRRLFPATLRVLDLEDRALGLRETLLRLEKLGFLDDAAVWLRRKELRDRLVHEYPDDPADRVADLSGALEEAAAMIGELGRFRATLIELGVTFDD